MDILNTVLAMLALVVAVASFIYSWHFNRFGIELTGCIQEKIDDKIRISFFVNNVSSRAIWIKSITLSKGQVPVKDNGFSPAAYEEAIQLEEDEERQRRFDSMTITERMSQLDIVNTAFPTPSSPDAESQNLIHAELLMANDRNEYSYYVDQIPDKITVRTDRAIFRLRHQRSFTVKFDQYD